MTRALVIAVLSAATLIEGPAAISGRVVAHDTGNPIAGARVRVVSADRHAPFVVSDSDGRFSVTLPRSTSHLVTIKSGYIRRETRLADGGGPLTVRLVRASVVSGRVVDRFGDPVVDAMVNASVVSVTNRAVSTATTASTRTDDAGKFRLPGLSPGRFVVSVVTLGPPVIQPLDGGLRSSSPRPTTTYYPDATTPDEAEIVTLSPGDDRSGIDFVVAAGQTGGVPFNIAGPFGSRTSTSAGPSTPTASIAGRVIASDGRPLRRASVRLIATRAGVALTATNATDDDGRFTFENVPAGRYRVVAAKPGYTARPADVAFAAVPQLGAGPWIDVADSESKEGVVVTLSRFAAVSGFVFDEFGDPMQGASVQLMRVHFERGRRRLVATGEARLTDDRGHYRIFNVPAGDYVVAASAGALASTDIPGYARSYYPGTIETGSAQFVSVRLSDDVSGIDFSMQAARTALVAGTIVDPDGAPTQPGMLQLRAAASASVASVAMNAVLERRGQFAFPNVPPGQYVIYADRGRKGASSEGEFVAMPIAVAGDDVTDVTVQMSAGSSVAGRITFETSGATRLPARRDLALMPVPVDPDLCPANVAEATVEADWTFHMNGITGVRRLVPTRVPDGWALRTVRVGGVEATDAPIAFGRRDQSLSDVEVVLTDRVSQIAGTAVDRDGRPAAGARVVVMPIDRDRRYPASRFLRSQVTADDGLFKIAGLPAAAYYVAAFPAVLAEDAEAWQDQAFLESLTATARTVTIGDGEAQSVTVPVNRP